jgi:beta-hydroxylase
MRPTTLAAPTTRSAPVVEVITPATPRQKSQTLRYIKKAVKRLSVIALFVVVPLLFGVYWIPIVFAGYVILGIIDVMRNTRRSPSTIDRYFFGNGFFTWILSPFNLLMDILCLPFRNKGVYNLGDLPKGHQDEINELIEATKQRDLLAQLESKMGEKRRGMIFFKWYGKNIDTSLDVPEFRKKFKYIRTIGVSIFNKRSSTGKHYGPLRISIRVLYNINNIEGKSAYIRVGNQTNYWSEKKLFIFDDTLQHRSVNETDGLRACMFVDILRPTMVPWLTGSLLTGVRLLMAPFRAIFYKHWTFIK